MEQKKLWYALLCDEEDNDWGTGTFDRAEAIEKMNNGDGYYKLIAVIDANYDENGKPTSDGVCVEEIRAAEAADAFETFEAIVADWQKAEAEELAEKIKESDKWDTGLCARLAELADMSEEYAAADGETFESVVFAAAEKLGVDIL